MKDKVRILIVDDLPENLLSMKAILESEEYILDTAKSGEEALLKVLEHEYAVILLDVQMPEMDGFEVAKFLKGTAKTKYIPIIFVTANLEEELEEIGYKEGAVDYIVKPVNPFFLKSKVRVFTELYRQRKLIEEQKEELEALNKELQKRLDEIKVLRGFIPICASCKKVKDVSGMWEEIENYIENNSEVEFSHSLCPECMKKLYPDIYKKKYGIDGTSSGNSKSSKED